MKSICYMKDKEEDVVDAIGSGLWGFVNQIDTIQRLSEEAEERLSYVSICKSEHERKKLGSYYTPTDVADFFWRELFNHSQIFDYDDALSFVEKYRFFEPAAGAGALIFALLKKLASFGLSPVQLSEIDLSIVDVNPNALAFVEKQLKELENNWGVRFSKVKFVYLNFLDISFDTSSKPLFFFGNPPFVSNNKVTSNWKIIYADFLEKALNNTGMEGGVHFVVPLSIAFSRDYISLREMILHVKGTVVLSNFDNIPDTLFKSGKPSHTNTNKANSQRCTILTILPGKSNKILATGLLRWSKKERSAILGKSPKYFDVSNYTFDHQFPRPASESVLDYLKLAEGSKTLGSLVSKEGKHTLFVASVARNYVSLREGPANGVHSLSFRTEDDFLLAVGVLSSDLFLSYWLSLGDGFHLTKGNIFNFPLHETLLLECARNTGELRKTWRMRRRFQKGKLNSGKMTTSFDLRTAVPRLIGV